MGKLLLPGALFNIALFFEGHASLINAFEFEVTSVVKASHLIFDTEIGFM